MEIELTTGELADADLPGRWRDYVRVDGRKFPNTDRIPTQPLRVLRSSPRGAS